MTCQDIDECATANGGCSAACANSPGAFECYAPPSCAVVKQKVPTFTSGDVTLYLGGDASKPWRAFCTTVGVEYLSLTSAANYAQYSSPGSNVRTTYTKLRIIPAANGGSIDIDDKTYATSTGSLDHDGTTVTSMAYGCAMDCEGSSSASGVASIDLTGTPFVVTETFANRGSSAQGTSNVQGGGRIVSLTGGGNCGWRGPQPVPYNPFNSIGSMAILELGYSP